MYLFLLWVISNSLTPHMELFFFSSLQLGEGASQVALMVKNPPANARDIEMQVPSLGQENPLEEVMTNNSSILAWRTPWTEESDRLCL